MNPQIYTSELLERTLVSAGTFELALARPSGFRFLPGQRIRLLDRSRERDYSLANGPEDSSLRLCIRWVPDGNFSTKLRSADIGSRFSFSGPHGYFVFKPSGRPAVFVATGTGAAPFASMARSGARGFTLLHGVRSTEELVYADLFQSAADRYVACISGKALLTERNFPGRVTAYIERQLSPGAYDFYLSGRREMVRDVTWLIDEHFPESKVFSEVFF